MIGVPVSISCESFLGHDCDKYNAPQMYSGLLVKSLHIGVRYGIIVSLNGYCMCFVPSNSTVIASHGDEAH
jgi:hypothetical protein